ncbi:hypothetical protein [Brevundimonas aurantiaca]|uniref:hypothetical protein n=1 Tax=Brevundimonas aurantiaca TaxID=74316 RepID=UPI001CD6D9B7|nr:hypothetical protein [Brevundimonas aurantiaca]
MRDHARLARLISLCGETLALGLGGLFLRRHRRTGHDLRRGLTLSLQLALAFEDRPTKVAGQRRPELRDRAIVAGQVRHGVGGRAAIRDDWIVRLIDDMDRARSQRQPSDAGDGERTDRRPANDDAAFEADDAARGRAQGEGFGRGLGRRDRLGWGGLGRTGLGRRIRRDRFDGRVGHGRPLLS